MRRKNRTALICSITLLSLLASALPAAEPAAKPQRKTKLGIILSKETTYIIGPVNADGTVNYVAYFKAKYSKGVTAANNAAIPLLHALGPNMLPEEIRDSSFKALKLKPLPQKGKYFVPLEEFLQRRNLNYEQIEDIKDDLSNARSRPWKAKEFPEIVAWLKTNEAPLATIVSGSKRPRYYFPIMGSSDSSSLSGMFLPSLSHHGEAMKALAAIAMLMADAGEWGVARAYLATIGRWARLTGQGPYLIAHLIGLAEDGIRQEAIKGIITGVTLSEAQAKSLLADMDSLPPLPDIRQALANDRFMSLDCVMLMAGGRVPAHAKKDDGLEELRQIDSMMAKLGQVDWNIPLRICNTWHDKVDAIAALKTARERDAATERFRREKASLAAELLKLKPLLDSIAKTSKKTSPEKTAAPIDSKVLSETIGKMFVDLLLPSGGRAVTIQERHAMNCELARVGLALAAERARTGKFPAKLATLSPRYLKAIPKDVFSGKALIYKRTRRGYLLYSIGENLKDDGGKDDERKGDQVIRVK